MESFKNLVPQYAVVRRNGEKITVRRPSSPSATLSRSSLATGCLLTSGLSKPGVSRWIILHSLGNQSHRQGARNSQTRTPLRQETLLSSPPMPWRVLALGWSSTSETTQSWEESLDSHLVWKVVRPPLPRRSSTSSTSSPPSLSSLASASSSSPSSSATTGSTLSSSSSGSLWQTYLRASSLPSLSVSL